MAEEEMPASPMLPWVFSFMAMFSGARNSFLRTVPLVATSSIPAPDCHFLGSVDMLNVDRKNYPDGGGTQS